jgi:hypothetical protein
VRFRFKADCVFEAEDIDHALEMIADHFRALSNPSDDWETISFESGELSVEREQ